MNPSVKMDSENERVRRMQLGASRGEPAWSLRANYSTENYPNKNNHHPLNPPSH